MKKILKSDGMQSFASYLAAGYIWFVHKTTVWRHVNAELANANMNEGKPFIMAFWHGRLLMMAPFIPRKRKSYAMISHHGDGALIARTVKHLGIDSVRGSTSKGGVPAIKEMLRILKRNDLAIITPDGPRGPRMHAQDGVVGIAAMSGMPVIPVSYSSSRIKFLKTWDRFALAKPFAKGTIVWGDPIYVERRDVDGAHQKAKEEIEAALIYVTQESDRLCGNDPIQPETVASVEAVLEKAN